VDWVFGAMPVDDVPDALARLVTTFAAERREGEPFHAWARRHSPEELRACGQPDVVVGSR
jgi:ferredoxin-nitrite reductase